MTTAKTITQEQEKFGLATRALAGICHRCGVCAYAESKPGTAFCALMRWHRNWCPAWASHTKVYGEKSLTR